MSPGPLGLLHTPTPSQAVMQNTGSALVPNTIKTKLVIAYWKSQPLKFKLFLSVGWWIMDDLSSPSPTWYMKFHLPNPNCSKQAIYFAQWCFNCSMIIFWLFDLSYNNFVITHAFLIKAQDSVWTIMKNVKIEKTFFAWHKKRCSIFLNLSRLKTLKWVYHAIVYGMS